jgi:acetyl-CoA carboxylase carboxyl transferase subunit alpha
LNPVSAKPARQRREPQSEAAVVSAIRFAVEMLGGSALAAWESATSNGTHPEAETTSGAQQELERIEGQVHHLESVAGHNQDARRQLQGLQQQIETLRRQIEAHAHAWRKTELARHPQRPYFLDYVERLFTDFSELHGDRGYADDPAIVCGMARFEGEEILVVGQQKGRDTKQKVHRNWGMPNPEGYRKALRAMQLAAKFRRPIFTFVDTPGAYPGLGAEERGQAEAIARNLREMVRLEVPIITTVTGEGGSGGALAIAVADRVLMLENSIYSVISPEGCASIMWRDATKKDLAAEALKITPEDLVQLGCVDGVVSEPEGGAHTDHDKAAQLLGKELQAQLSRLKRLSPADLVQQRYDKFRKMASFFEQ